MFAQLVQKKVIKVSTLGVALMLAGAGCNGGTAGNEQFEQATGLKAPVVDLTNTAVVITESFPALVIQGGATAPIPHMPNSGVTVGPDIVSGGTMVQVVLDARDLLAVSGSAGTVLPPGTLPDGRPLPILGGVMPSIGVQIPEWHDIVLYFGKNGSKGVVAAFVPVDMPMKGYSLHYGFVSNGRVIGQISAIGKNESDKGSGIFLALNIGKNEQKLLSTMANAALH